MHTRSGVYSTNTLQHMLQQELPRNAHEQWRFHGTDTLQHTLQHTATGMTSKYTRAVAFPWHQHTTAHVATQWNKNDLEMHTSSGFSMALTHYNTRCNTLQQIGPLNAHE